MTRNLPPLRRLPDLPASAWLYRRDGQGEVILAGPRVLTFPGGIFEGCWSGDFCEAGFAAAENVFGTGLALVDGQVRFVTPSHVQEGLFAWIGGRTVAVSNSLAFLVEQCGIELPYGDWGRRFHLASRGIDAEYRLLLRTDRGRLIRVLHDNFEIRDGELEIFRPDVGPGFPDFAAYRDHLREQLRLAVANGRDPARETPLRLVVAVSSGYDSTAALALTAEFGPDLVLTLSRDSSGDGDSGAPVAADLGLHASAKEYRRGSGSLRSEAEFIATGSGGEDLQFAIFDRELENGMLVNGFYGDAVWNPAVPAATDLRKGERAGNSLGEFCLRLGATQLPVPLIGARHHPDIRRIGLSTEMAPWRIGGEYDRPVARRIAEEAGVRRDHFGQRKRATSQHVFRSGAYLSPESMADLRAREGQIVGAGWIRYRLQRAWHDLRWALFRAGILVFNNKLGTAQLRRPYGRLLLGDAERFSHSHPRYSDALFLWALGHQRGVYRDVPGQQEPMAGDAP